MQSMKYLEIIINEENRFGVVLKKIALKKENHIQLQIALSLLEYLNQGKYINKNDIQKDGNLFYVSKEKYFKTKSPPKSKVFAIRIKKTDSDEEIDKKIAELEQKVRDYRNLKL